MKKSFLIFIILFGTNNSFSQNIGIGANAPLMKLHVANTDSAIALFENTQPLAVGVSNAIYFKTGSGGYNYTGALKTIGQTNVDARLGFFTYASQNANGLFERVSILDNGNVGIGTTNPVCKLDVTGVIKISDGSEANGKFLMSDDNGVATWKKIDTLPAGNTQGNLVTYDGTNWVAKNLKISPAGGGQPIDNRQPYLAMNYCIAVYGIFPSRNGLEPYIGEIQLFGFNFNPRDYLPCDGQLLPIAQNTALFSLLGTLYGGNGITTFALPDLRGRVPIHYGQGAGLQNYSVGQTGGTETITIQNSQMPSHTHTVYYE